MRVDIADDIPAGSMFRGDVPGPLENVRITDESGVWQGVRCKTTGRVFPFSLETPSQAEIDRRGAAEAERDRLDDIDRPRRVAQQIRESMIALQARQSAAESLGFAAEAAEAGARIDVLRAKIKTREETR